MKICYVGHPAHKWSRSDEFFLDLLKEFSEVTEIRPGPLDVRALLWGALHDKYDLYIFWQLDYLAVPFVKAGKRVVVVPMLDGSGSAPAAFFYRDLGSASFISFSKVFHRFFRFGGIRSLNLHYAPEVQVDSYVAPAKTAAYIWPRSQKFYDLNKLGSMLERSGLQLSVRQGTGLEFNLPNGRNQFTTTIESREDHLKELSCCALFIAPRPVEGIGHSFLEALAIGRAVMSPDLPTMNEYIRHGENGFLFPSKSFLTSLPSFEEICKAGRKGQIRLARERESYLSDVARLPEFLFQTRAARPRTSWVKSFELALRRHASGGLGTSLVSPLGLSALRMMI